ncbi:MULTISPECIES: glycosyltransferase family 2 protein [unclassified Bacteroides]|uniref:glycosyltransferase family 2 protein n=1 Tax=unclassified Bacteroides TaxID=2646097 RepID=UPI0013EC38C0|nr:MULTISPECIES: glycosyltransferase family 2 protein [unclassified Bacteroides]QTO24455.1 glycosyltransferase family 2 protein [Bacteroides sp. ZJ-18]
MQTFISVVTTLYKSANYLERFVQLCERAFSELECVNCEIIMVNDGSPDNSLEKALELKEEYPNIVVVDLSRNFGHHYALWAGLSISKGEYIFTIDCDLEVSPLCLVNFMNRMKSGTNIDVVYGIQEVRKGHIVERLGGALFYSIFNKISGIQMPKNVLTENLMNRKYIDSLLKLGDKSLFLAGMYQWVGFNQVPLIVTKGLREGKSTYTLKKRIALTFQAITSFSSYPLIVLLNVGFLITTLSFIWGIGFIIYRVFNPDIVLLGFTSLFVLILFSLGIIVFSLGVIGLYIDRIFTQTKNRPTYIIREIY